MSDIPADQTVLRVADLPQRKAHRFTIEPDAATLAETAQMLGFSDLRKVKFIGQVQAEGKRNWRLQAVLGATVVQPCVVTLDPVTTRIDQKVTRRYLADYDTSVESDEIEMPEDETEEALPDEIDLGALMIEALALAAPDYPRAENAELGEAAFAAKGVTPLRDEDTKPFAGLAGLKEKLQNPDD